MWIPWALIALGWALRLRLYFAGRSLRHDEASLTLNLITRSVRGLVGPLDREQGAPLGFLLLEKLSIQWLGDGELALRLVPLLAGLAVLPLFYALARRILVEPGVSIAVAIVALSEPLILYSAEVKQYSLDAASALALLVIAVRAWDGLRLWTTLLALAGTLAIWLSHPAVFVLAGIGLALSFRDVRESRWRRLSAHVFLAAIWAMSFLINDRFFLRYLRANEQLLDFWSGAFAPFPPRSAADVRWYLSTLFNVFKDPVGLPAAGLAVLACLLGAWEFGKRNMTALVAVLASIAFALAASALRKYPFAGRLILFTAPLFTLLIAEGLSAVARLSDRRARAIVIIWTGLLLAEPALNAARTLLRPPEGEELRPVLASIQRLWRDGDRIYVYHGGEAAFSYYVGRTDRPFRFDAVPILGASGRDDWNVYPKDLAKIKGSPRAWIVFSHIVKVSGVDEERFLLFFLDRVGHRIREIPGFGASAYLYDLAPAAAARAPARVPRAATATVSARVDRGRNPGVH
jgi:Dolichyl-phosphate-mannose-protein mannosyltransferase